MIFLFLATKNQADVIMEQYIITTRSSFCGWLRTYQLHMESEMFFPACTTLSLHLDCISCAILSVLHSPSVIFHVKSLPLLSGITKFQLELHVTVS